MEKRPYFASPKPSVVIPARIVIEQQPNGQFTCTHNLKVPQLIGVLSMFINIHAGQLAQQESLIIQPNNRQPIADPQPEPQTPGEETKPNGNAQA